MKYIFPIFTLCLTILIVGSVHAKECSVELSSKLLYTGEISHTSIKDIFKSSSCPTSVQNTLLNILTDLEGNIREKYINAVFKNELEGYEIKLQPSSISILSLKSMLKEQFAKDSSTIFSSVSILTNNPIFHLTNDQQVSLSCNNCNTPGSKHIKIEINDPISGTKKIVWIKANIAILTKALKVTGHLSANTTLSKKIVELVDFQSNHPDRIFTDLDKIKFYKLNKPLSAGSAIKKSDLTPMILVRPGALASVNIKSSGINLSIMAMPLHPAKIGQPVRLKNRKSKKIIYGKVIDFNKVVLKI